MITALSRIQHVYTLLIRLKPNLGVTTSKVTDASYPLGHTVESHETAIQKKS